MIKANELRIGNWIKDIEGSEFLFQVEGRHIMRSEQFPIFRPILLTSEILEKCGFKKGVYIYQDGSKSDSFILEGRRYLITKINVGSLKEPDEYYSMQYFPYPQSQNTIGARLEYLHQLQNLYFALTYKELEIKF